MYVSIPVDQDGFLRRECPHCNAQFKWHLGPVDGSEPDASPEVYFCPLCGQSASPDSWFTEQQLEYARDSATPEILRQLASETGLTIDQVKSAPPALTDPNDMQIVASPCHDHEPIKVPEELRGPFHCLVCGEPFAL